MTSAVALALVEFHCRTAVYLALIVEGSVESTADMKVDFYSNSSTH